MTLPFLGVWLYKSTGLGTATILVAAALNVIGAFGFYFTRKLKPVADN